VEQQLSSGLGEGQIAELVEVKVGTGSEASMDDQALFLGSS